jgi:hypothetical protein
MPIVPPTNEKARIRIAKTAVRRRIAGMIPLILAVV